MNSPSNHNPKKTSRLKRGTQFSMLAVLVIMTVFAILATLISANRRHQQRQKMVREFETFVEQGNLEEVDKLLKFEPGLAHGREHHGIVWRETALQMAIRLKIEKFESSKVFARILKENPDLEETSDRGETALTIAAKSGRFLGADVVLPLMEELIRRGADVNGGTPMGSPVRTSTPIQGAAYGTKVGTKNLEVLLEAGADVGLSHRFDGLSCLHLAVANNNKDAVELLIGAGADVSGKDAEGETPLHVAMVNNWIDIARLLVKHGGDPVAKDKHNRIPSEGFVENNSLVFEAIVRAHEEGDVGKADALLAAAPQVLTWTNDSPMLAKAATQLRTDVVAYLLSKGVDPAASYESRNRGSRSTVLHEVAGSRWIQRRSVDPSAVKTIVAMLVDARADVNAKDGYGNAPLHLAAGHHCHQMIELLIERGADVDVRDSTGASVMEKAFHQFEGENGIRTLRILAEAGHEKTPLYAAAMGDIELLKEFYDDDSAMPSRRFSFSMTSLYAAVVGDQVDAVNWLLDHGADVDVRTQWHNQPLLMVALDHGYFDVAVALIDGGADVKPFRILEGSTQRLMGLRAKEKAKEGSAGAKKILEMLESFESQR